MSDKVTFRELVEAISEQSENSKSFTHDFLKDLVSVVQEGLETHGKVNIAGFGKFELKKMSEREGYNPQTGEKITIPEHNKVVFKPYKDLREVVNAPYEHLEAEKIEPEEEKTADEATAEAETTAEETIPPSPLPTEAEAQESEAEEEPADKAPWEEEMESEPEIVDEEDPFGLDAKYQVEKEFQQEQEEPAGEDSDVVEFTPESDAEEGQPEEEELPAEKEQPAEEEQMEKAGAIAGHEVVEEEDFTGRSPESDTEEETAETAIPLEAADPPKRTHRRNRRDAQRGHSFWIIAAGFILILMVVGAWYYLAYEQTSKNERVADTQQEQPVTPSPAGEQEPSDETAGEASSAQQDQNRAEAGNGSTGQAQQQTAAGGEEDKTVKTITISKGQTLWGLADENYRNARLWPWIYDTNQPEIENPNLIFVGQQLDIPLMRGDDNSLSTNDSLQVAIGYVETYRWYKENGLDNAKFYLYTAKKYHNNVLQYIDVKIDEADLAFANRHK